MSSPGNPIVPVTDEGTAYTAETVSSAQGISEASASSVMNADVLSAFGVFGNSSSNGLVTTAQSIGGTTWGAAVNSAATSALSGADSANDSIGTISTGVSGNITGAEASADAAGVGPAVQLLNATVQASGSAPQVDVFNQAGLWSLPSGIVTANLMLLGGGGGGAQGGLGTTGAAGGGGGAGGYSLYNAIAAASLPTTAAVVVGLGGGGGVFTGAAYEDTFDRAAASTLGSPWRADGGYGTAQISGDVAEAWTPNDYYSENGCWSTYTTALSTDNYMVEAQLAPPSVSLATNNYSGIYVAAPTTYSGASLLVVFAGDAGGCGIVTQSNAPSSPYVTNGGGTGQTIQAQTAAVTFGTSSLIKLTRLGNVFTGWVNGVVAVTWTDTGNIVPTGASNRLWGFVVETNWPTFNVQYDSPAVSDIKAADIPGWSEPGISGAGSSFNGVAYQVGGGAGGVGGGIDASDTRRPSTGSFLDTSTSWTGAAGTGNQTNTGSGGVGAAGVSGFQPAGQAGGAGVNTDGGDPGTSITTVGNPGAGPVGGAYGPASGGGGGFWVTGSTGRAGDGGSGGFPGGGGGGGGATVDGAGLNGLGGPGGDGQVVVTSNFT